MKYIRAKLRAIWWIMRSNNFVLTTELMCMAAVRENPVDKIMILAHLEAETHMLRGGMPKHDVDIALGMKNKLRTRLLQSQEKEK